MATSVTNVYLQVVDDVISKVREEFLSFGVGDNILNELQGLWEMKMVHCGAISGNTERPPAPKNAAVVTPVHDLNVPYEGSLEEYETPTAEMLFPPTPMQTPIPTPLPLTSENLMYQTPTPGDFASTDDTNEIEMKVGRPSPYMSPSPWMNPRQLGVDVNVAYDEGRDDVNRGASNQRSTQDFLTTSSGKRKRDDNASRFPPGGRYIPQQDGTCDVGIEILFPEMGHPVTRDGSKTATSGALSFQRPGLSSELPQLDGMDGDEPPLNEDDDLDDPEQEEEELNTEHLVLAQFDKVTRAKNKWKCTLKDGIMHINSKDVLFNKASGEFEF
ncbi:unnamed protein product [Spirodela intermedia]|uniref:Uncharacterized protein n=1 Tax=Spirodela intermedia TaxID=51605 RepID=A0A7I8KKB5_SPIIN|nr:unnamed protein product [Spirodela intermedia]